MTFGSKDIFDLFDTGLFRTSFVLSQSSKTFAIRSFFKFSASTQPENRPRCLLQREQGNFKLAANFGYSSRGSADPRESLRKRRILNLALTAHKVLLADSAIGFQAVYWL